MIKVQIRPHPYFKRDGSNISTEKLLTVTQAILGGTVKVTTLNGKIDVNVKMATTEGTT